MRPKSKSQSSACEAFSTSVVRSRTAERKLLTDHRLPDSNAIRRRHFPENTQQAHSNFDNARRIPRWSARPGAIQHRPRPRPLRPGTMSLGMDAVERKTLEHEQSGGWRPAVGHGCELIASAGYALLVVGLLAALLVAALPLDVASLLRDRQLWHSLRLSLISATISTVLAVAMAIPCSRWLARDRFPGRAAIELLFELPLLVSPVVLGFGLLALCLTPPGRAADEAVRSVTAALLPDALRIAYDTPAILLAQFVIGAAIATSCLRAACGSQASPARGRSRTASRDILRTAVLTWARAVGEFGPVLIAADAIALKTEILPTRLYVELKAGQLQAAAVAALLLVLLSLLAHGVLRRLGGRPSVQIQECEP